MIELLAVYINISYICNIHASDILYMYILEAKPTYTRPNNLFNYW